MAASYLNDVDLSALTPDLVAAVEELARREWLLESLKAQRRQNALAAAQGPAAPVDGLGQLRRQVDTFAFMDWGLKEGFGVWQDPQFNRYYDRIAPETKVEHAARAPRAGFRAALTSGWDDALPPKRFTKTYHEPKKSE